MPSPDDHARPRPHRRGAGAGRRPTHRGNRASRVAEWIVASTPADPLRARPGVQVPDPTPDDQLRAGVADKTDARVSDRIFNDAVNAGHAVQNRITLAHAEALTLGKVTLTELGDVDAGSAIVANFGVPGGLIDSYRAELGTVATSLASAVNAIHPGFFSVTHAPPASYGGDTLAVSATTASLFPGATSEASANQVARAVSELSGKGPDSAYNAFVARVGSEVRAAVGNAANAQALTDSVQDRRESVMGVSLDEEMGNIIKFQRAYQASSRAMSTMDEMLDVLINRTGRVGL